METLLQDIRFGFRQLMKQPGFAALAIISMALGIGVERDGKRLNVAAKAARAHFGFRKRCLLFDKRLARVTGGTDREIEKAKPQSS